MRLRFLEMNNFLSFGPECQRIEFDNDLTVFVGPNGVGKTNVIRAIDTVKDVITSTVSGAWNFPIATPQILEQQSRTHYAHLDKQSEIALGVDFLAVSEKDEIASFVRAAILSSLYESWSHSNSPSSDEKRDLISQVLKLEVPRWLMSGSVCLVHGVSSSDQWQLSYKTEPKGPVTIQWLLTGNYSSHISLDGVDRSRQTSTSTVEAKFQQSGPGPASFDHLIPIGEELVGLYVQNYSLINLARDFPVVNELSLQLGSYNWYPRVDGTQRTYGFNHVLDSLLQTRLFSDIEDSPLGKPLNVTAQSLATANSPIFRTGEIRIPRYLEQLYRWQNGTSAERARFSEAQTLFSSFRKDESFGLRLSPGRMTPSAVTETMNAVQQTTSNPGEQPSSKDWFTLIPFVERRLNNISGGGKPSISEVSADQAGSGAAELIRLSTFLATGSESVVLLDEPMARLHPTLQRRFIDKLQVAEAQYIVVSHSPGLFPTRREQDNDYSNFVKRVAFNENRESRVYSLPVLEELEIGNGNNRAKPSESINLAKYVKVLRTKIQKEIASRPTVLEIPFAERLILVSGESEFVAYQAWYRSYRRGDDISESLHFHSFGGDDRLDVALAIAMAFHVPYMAIVDGASFKPTGEIDGVNGKVPLVLGQLLTAAALTGRNEILEHVNELAPKVVYTKSQVDNVEWMELAKANLESFGVLTFANCWNSDELKEGKECRECQRTNARRAKGEEYPAESHQESFEDICFTKFPEIYKVPEFVGIPEEDKINRARKLVELQPECPDFLYEIFRNER